MEELFCKLELLRQEMNKLAKSIPGADKEMLLDDLHRLRGRLMQIKPNDVRGHIWQNTKGSVVVRIENE